MSLKYEEVSTKSQIDFIIKESKTLLEEVQGKIDELRGVEIGKRKVREPEEDVPVATKRVAS